MFALGYYLLCTKRCAVTAVVATVWSVCGYSSCTFFPFIYGHLMTEIAILAIFAMSLGLILLYQFIWIDTSSKPFKINDIALYHAW